MLRSLYYSLPSSLRFTARRLWYAPIDIIDRLSGRRDKLTPPKGLIFTGGGDFKAQGLKFLTFFRQLGGLQAHHHVLDVGSGMGRMAIPLLRYLNEQGSYDGIDIVKDGIDWCQDNITAERSDFRFHHSDIYNDLYNTGGAIPGHEYEFPFDNETFNFTFLTSVFTHMLKDEVEQYIKEISRTLKPGGICFATFFVINEEALASMNTSGIHFPFEKDGFYVMNEKVETANVGYPEEYITSLAAANGMEIDRIHFGKWCNRKEFTDFQDFVIMRKKTDA